MPTDPIILLSFVNMKLRDEYADLDDLCRAFDTDKGQVIEKLAMAGYVYREENRQFVPKKGDDL